MSAVQEMKKPLAAMREITRRAPWGGGLRSMSKADQASYEAHDRAFMEMASKSGLGELQAIKLCDAN